MEASKIKQATISTGRALLLLVIFGIALGALLAAQPDNSRWWLGFLIIAVAGFFAFWKLYARWCKTDKWLKAYNDSCEKVLEAPNPYYIGKEEESK